VAGGLIASAGSAAIGLDGSARLMFGYGIICWLVLGSILLLRLFTRPPLPTPLVPTIAIEIAPSVVAGNAWFQINGSRAGGVVLLLSGHGLLMVLAQLRLIPLYLRVPFGPGSWAFAFSYAAAFTVAIRWLAAEHIQQQHVWTYLLLAVISIGSGALAMRTIADLVRGHYLPRAQPG
jgi:tellurite resistance protein